MIYSYQQKLSCRLLLWSIGSIILGAWLQRAGDKQRRAFGQQAAAWGAFNAAIALVGWITTHRRASDPQNHALRIQTKQADRLRRLLWINAGLDVLYVLGGLRLRRRRDERDRGWQGHGWGIVTQALFLLLFDCSHALRLPSPQRRGA